MHVDQVAEPKGNWDQVNPAAIGQEEAVVVNVLDEDELPEEDDDTISDESVDDLDSDFDEDFLDVDDDDDDVIVDDDDDDILDEEEDND